VTGRGSGTLTDSSLATSSFFYYIVDANNIRFLSEDVGVTGSGRAEKQSGTPALSGSYAFGSEGDTINFLEFRAGRSTAAVGQLPRGARHGDGSSVVNAAFTELTLRQPASRHGRPSTGNSNLVV
jgi:hypothetical protein